MEYDIVLHVDKKLGSWALKAQSLVYAVVKMYEGTADLSVASLLVATGWWRRLRFFEAIWKEQGVVMSFMDSAKRSISAILPIIRSA